MKTLKDIVMFLLPGIIIMTVIPAIIFIAVALECYFGIPISLSCFIFFGILITSTLYHIITKP